MFRTENSVGMLKSIAMIAGLAILLWSLGLPSLRFADAANVTSFSDTISDSAPSASANHTIDYTTTATGGGVAAGGGFLEFTFPAGFDLSTIGAEDLDLLVATVDQNITGGANWTVSTTSTTIRFTAGASVSIGQGVAVQVLIGLHATNSGVPNSQIVNPSAEGSNEITLTSGVTDAGATRVVILTAVTVSATVNTVFTFTVSGVTAGGTVNGESVTGTTGSTTIPFGILSAAVATTSAQQLSVTTNASNGYVVTVQVDGALRSSTGADIDGFSNGSDTDVPAAWAAPTAVVGSEATYGHWGVTTDDYNTFARGTEFSATNQWVAASTSPRAIMGNNAPANGVGVGVGTTTVGYKVEISSLQEAGNDYSTTLTYVATPTF